MINFETLSNLFDAITSKKSARPSLYMFELKIFEEGYDCWNELQDDHEVFTVSKDLMNTKKIFEIANIDFKELPRTIRYTLILEAARTKLFKISSKMIKKYFGCDSADDFYNMIEFAWFHKNDAGEVFFEKNGLYLVFSDGEFFVGFGQKELENIYVEPEKDEV